MEATIECIEMRMKRKTKMVARVSLLLLQPVGQVQEDSATWVKRRQKAAHKGERAA